MNDSFGALEHGVDRRASWRDERHVDITDANEIAFWTKAFDVSLMGLMLAIDTAGTSADGVRRFLARRASARPH